MVRNGLNLWGGAQLAIDTTLVSPLTRDGQPRRRAGTYAGAALHTARRSKERTYPEFLQSRRCRLVVLAFETGGRWSHEATTFIRMLAQSKARQAPALLHRSVMAALISRWSAMLSHAAMQSFAASLLDQNLSTHSNVDGHTPPVSQILAETPPPPPGTSRLPHPNCGLWIEHIWRLASIKTVSRPKSTVRGTHWTSRRKSVCGKKKYATTVNNHWGTK